MGRRQHRRRGLAIVACLLWLLGTEVLPAVHLAHHDDHHTHGANGAVVDVDHGDHHHAVAKSSAEHRERDLAQLAIDHPVEPGHQAGGVAHHAVAVLQAAPPALPPVIQLEAHVVPTVVALPAIAIGTQPSARGPPSQA